ncbi:hypothetical protein [Nostoc sp.]|uniref:hypothetical protein n=1 Tax=Nostoc sp. TaxID=1180 RepID=UPI002FF6FE04
MPHLLAWFSLVALMVKIVHILPENPGDSSYIQNLFLQSKKSIPDAILKAWLTIPILGVP